MGTIRFSLGAKVFVVVLGVCVALLGGLTAFFGNEQLESARHSLADKSVNYGKLASTQIEPAVAFGDREGAQEVLAGLTIDTDVKGAALYAADGKLTARKGDGAEPIVNATNAPIVVRDGRRIRCAAPVVSSRGARGMVVVEMSSAGLDRRLAAIRMTAAAVGLVGIVAAFAVASALGRYLGRRVNALTRNAMSVAEGRFDGLEPVDAGDDELGRLARSFGAMTTNLQQLIAQNAHRTEALASRTVQMRLLLDHVAQGFVTIDGNGELGPERSAILEQWFGALPPRTTLTELVARIDPDAGAWFELAWDEVRSGVLPIEVALAQMPKSIQHEGRSFDVRLTPISVRDDVLSTALVVITDVTEAREHDRTNEARVEILTVLGRALEDRASIAAFLDEGGKLVDAIVRDALPTLGDVKRATHTLKGNCGLFGLTSVASFCHELETRMADLQERPSPSDRRVLRERWSVSTSSLVSVFSQSAKGLVEISRRDLDGLVVAVDAQVPHVDLAKRVRMLRLESLSTRLQRVGEGASALAERLEKRVDVEIRAADVRFEPAAWAPFWSAFTHVLRNAVDHGIEASAVREAAAKPSAGTIVIDAEVRSGAFVLSVADDGRGIDWQAIAEKAATLGLPTTSPADVEAALFVDGFTSKAGVSDISGRGIGLGAVRAACVALGGVVHVESRLGEGTTFTFAFPQVALGDAYDPALDACSMAA